ncbi:MAG: hypothetical protein EA390_00570 [Balneolaceae bacterium]|nr:MAG: hypothetical protein EA390_00570 [Balneolaceae bacterium]
MAGPVVKRCALLREALLRKTNAQIFFNTEEQTTKRFKAVFTLSPVSVDDLAIFKIFDFRCAIFFYPAP